MCVCVSPISPGGVGLQDLFHYDWTEDDAAQEKAPQRENYKDRLSRLC